MVDTVQDLWLGAISAERDRQERLVAEGRFAYTAASGSLSLSEKLAILLEEMGEVAREVLTQPNDALAFDTSGSVEGLRKELVHVAAVSLAFLEGLEEPPEEPLPEPEPISGPQIAAFHAMTSALDDKHGVPRGTFKQRIKDEAGLESVKDLTYPEARAVLDRIALDLDAP